jgi:TolB-like protein/class 3 adenylate cyclase
LLSSYTIGPFRLDGEAAMLFHRGEPVALGPRAVGLLRVLVEQRGVPVSKDTLMEAAWTGLAVEESNLPVQIAALRRVLGKAPGGDRWIETLPRRGYRFVGPVDAQDEKDVSGPSPSQDKPSLAVLPFQNFSGDPEQEYFADGMVEEIITALSRIRWLFVTARNSSFAYKGQRVDVQRVGRELGVRYVLEGSVRKGGDRVRITAQLIEAGTGAHLWADRFDGPLGDIFDLQDRVASSVAGVIESALQAAEIAHSVGRPTHDLTAYDLYLRAQAMVWSSARRIPEALGFLEQAIARDPRYGPALAWAGFCCYRLLLDGRSDAPAIDRVKGADFARRALEVAGDDPGTLVNAAQALAYFGEDIDAMIALVDRALALNPNFARGWHSSAALRLNAGQPDTAIAHVETALRLSPGARVGTSLTVMGAAHFFTRRFGEAVPKLVLAIQEDPSFPLPYRYLAACYAHMGRLAEAREILDRLRAISSVTIPDASHLRNVEHRELFLSGLRLAAGGESASLEARPRVDRPREPVPSDHREAERRQITALFAELAGAAPPGDLVVLEDLREAVSSFRHCAAEAAKRHHGFLCREFGSSALVLFGYPEAHEHDAEQAVRAGLELCAAVRTMRPDPAAPMHCRVGIASGTVIIGARVEGAAQDESIVGDAPNVAARLALSATPDTVAFDPATRRLVGDLFDCRELGAIEAASGTEAILSWQVLGESAVASRFEALRGPALTPLIGRDEEIDLLLRRWARAKTGEGQVVLVSGEPGIGKSRIAAALEERLGGESRVRLRYFCSPYHQDSALHPFIEQLAHAAGFARDDAPAAKWEKLETLLALAAPPDEDVALLTDLLSLPASERHPLPSLSPQRKKDRTLEALIRQLEGLTRRRPVLSVFEDAHWIDPTSRELLDLTIERIRQLPVLLIVTFRPEFQPPWTGQEQVSTLALSRLDRHDRAALVEQIAGGKRLPAEVVAHIAEHADGVPLFVEELTKSILESRLLREEEDRYVLNGALSGFTIPTSLQASLLARLDRLASARHVAQIGAAIGRQFPYMLLRAVRRVPEDELKADLARLVTSELVSQRGAPPDAVYVFKHALVQDAAHSSLLRGARRRLHARIAEALETHFPEITESQPELLAQHYAEAGLPEKAIDYWLRAGKIAAARFASIEAIAHLRRGIEALGGFPAAATKDRLELDFQFALGPCLRAVEGPQSKAYAATCTRARALCERLGDAPEYPHIMHWLAQTHGYRGELPQALDAFTAALRLAEAAGNRPAAVNAMRGSGSVLLYMGRFVEGRRMFERSLAKFDMCNEAERLATRAAGWDAGVTGMAYMGWTLWALGYPEMARASAAAALQRAGAIGHPYSQAFAAYYASVLHALCCEPAVAHTHAEHCLALSDEHGFGVWRNLSRALRWICANQLDPSADSLASVSGELDKFFSTGYQFYITALYALLSQALLIRNQLLPAREIISKGLATAEQNGERMFEAEFLRLKARVFVIEGGSGMSSDAQKLLEEALALAQRQKARSLELRAAADLARLWRDQSRHAEARDLLAPVYCWFTEGFDTPDLKDAKALLDGLAAPSARALTGRDVEV